MYNKKKDNGIPCINSKKTLLIGYLFLAGHEKPSKNMISWTKSKKLDDIKLK